MSDKRFQIAFDVTEEFRKKLKQRALNKNISLNLYIHRALFKQMNEEDELTSGSIKDEE